MNFMVIVIVLAMCCGLILISRYRSWRDLKDQSDKVNQIGNEESKMFELSTKDKIINGLLLAFVVFVVLFFLLIGACGFV